MRRLFFQISVLVFALVFGAAYFWQPALWSLCLFGPLFLVGVNDLTQKRQAVRRNFPVIGNLRYFFELIRPELQQYFVESNQSGRPIPREVRSVVYQRAKGDTETMPFGTQMDVNIENYEWVNHSIMPKKFPSDDIRISVGGPKCTQPYQSSVMNISAMSYGALSPAAISALNLGAKEGQFSHNSGEGGLSPYHLLGGDVVWQIGTGYFGCRNLDGTFNEQAFRERAVLPNVKMIELKLSQGAKPGKGGILPGAKVTPEIAKIRLVEPGKDVVSPAAHSAFSTPTELLQFVQKLRELSGGKPVGFKFCVGKKHEFISICQAMVATNIKPDFITVDGGEGGTGAAPLEFSNHVGTPLEEGLAFVVDALRGFNLKKDVRVIASGKVFTSFNLLTKLALGADIVNSARGMMLALGCIQALKCNTNHCPVGVATTNSDLYRGLDIPSKKVRVARFQHSTVHNLAEMLGAMGYLSTTELHRRDIFRRLTDGHVKSYEEIHPVMTEGALLDSKNWKNLPLHWQRILELSQMDQFHAFSVLPGSA